MICVSYFLLVSLLLTTYIGLQGVQHYQLGYIKQFPLYWTITIRSSSLTAVLSTIHVISFGAVCCRHTHTHTHTYISSGCDQCMIQ